MAIGCKPSALLRSAARLWVCADIPAIPRRTVAIRYRHGRHMGPCRLQRAREPARRSAWGGERRPPGGLRGGVSDRRRDQPEARPSCVSDLARVVLDGGRHLVLLRVRLRGRARVPGVRESEAA